MKRKMKATALLLVVSLLFSLTGCGDSKEENKSSEPQAGTQTSGTQTDKDADAERKDPVTLRFMWWGGDERAAATLDVIDEFEALYPWITIEAEYGSSDGYQEKLTTQLVSGTVADIFQMGTGWMPGYVASNPDYFVDFKEYKEIIDLSTFGDSFLANNGSFDDKQYGLPTGISGHAFIYNTKLTETIGLDFSKAYTWDDLIAMGKQVKEYDDSMYLLTVGEGELNSMIVRPYLQQLTGNTVLQNDTKTMGFTEADLVQTLSFIRTLYENNVIAPIADVIAYGAELSTDAKWINQKYVGMFCYSSTIETVAAACPDGTFAAGKLPVLAGAKDEGWYCNCPQYMCVNGKSPNAEEAVMFLEFFYNHEKAAGILKTVRSVPPTSVGQSVCEELGLLNGIAKDSVEVIQGYTGTNDLGLTTEEEVTAILQDAAVQIAYDQDSAENVAKSTMKLLQNFLSTK